MADLGRNATPPPRGPSRGVAISIAATLLCLVVAGAVLWQYRDDGAPAAAPPDPPSSPGETVRLSADGEDCGEPVERPDGTPWECTFADDFDGDVLDPEHWTSFSDMLSGSGASQACSVDDPDNIAVQDGNLVLRVRRALEPTTCQGQRVGFTAGSVATAGLFSQQYGRFEARMKTTKTDQPGLHEAFWLWPDPEEPADGSAPLTFPAAGEIDVAETYSNQPGLAIPYLHYTADDNGGPIPGTNTAVDCEAERGVWHTYVLTWSPEELRIEVDGEACLVNIADDPAFDQRYLLALTAELGSDANAWVGGAPMPANTFIDHVRVWK